MGDEAVSLSWDQLNELKRRFQQTGRAEESSYVRISDDKMEAWLYLAEVFDERGYTFNGLVDFLEKQGVTRGYIKSRLIAMSKKGIYRREILIARGKEAAEGKDGYFEYLFDTNPATHTPEILEDGSVDYRSVCKLENVEAGDLIAVYHPAVAGEEGYCVDGTVVAVNPVKELMPLKGSTIVRKGDEYFANCAGRIEMRDGNIDIRNLYEVREDVDYNNGRIDFFGDVVVSGNVGTGAEIRAGRNLTITGTVESASLYAGGDITLQRGVQGDMTGKIRCKGSVFANFIEQCKVEADKNVVANYIMNATVYAGEKVQVKGKRGNIIGGYVCGLQGVESQNIGNAAEVKTVVHAGFGAELYKQWSRLVAREENIREKLEDVLSMMELIIKHKEDETGLRRGGTSLAELNTKKDEYFQELDQIVVDIEEIKKKIEVGKGAKINVTGSVYKGAVIEIENAAKTITGQTEHSLFKCKAGEIEITTAI